MHFLCEIFLRLLMNNNLCWLVCFVVVVFSLFPCFLFCRRISLVSQPYKLQGLFLCFGVLCSYSGATVERVILLPCWISNAKTLACIFNQITPLCWAICRYYFRQLQPCFAWAACCLQPSDVASDLHYISWIYISKHHNV